jgi:hypothetical protein
MAVRAVLFLILLMFCPGLAMAQSASGDIFVSSDVEGSPVWLDGRRTGEKTPVVLKGVEIGAHLVRVQTPCGNVSEEVDVRPGRISRVELRSPDGFGTLRILPDPSNARVRIDGKPQNLSEPLITLDCGLHQVEVRAPGHQGQVRSVRVAAGSHQELAVTLQAIVPGTLVVDIYPLNATIYLDGERVAQGPVTLEPVSAGSHVLMASAEGYAELSRVVEVVGNDITRIDLTMELADMVATPRQPIEREVSPEVPVTRAVVPEVAAVTSSAVGDAVPLRAEGTDNTRSARGVGIGLTVLGLGAGAYAASQYPVAIDIYDQYLDAETDDEAEDRRAELLPVQRRMLGSGILGGVSLVTGGIVWVRASNTSQLSVGVGPRALEIQGTW